MVDGAALCRELCGHVLVDCATAQFAGAGSACVAVLALLLNMHERWAARIFRPARLQLLGCGWQAALC
jgi:hypothetical protein